MRAYCTRGGARSESDKVAVLLKRIAIVCKLKFFKGILLVSPLLFNDDLETRIVMLKDHCIRWFQEQIKCIINFLNI